MRDSSDFQKNNFRFNLLTALMVVLLALVTSLILTSPAANRELALDDRFHLGLYPQLNESLSFTEILSLRHWQDHHSDGLWRPIPKVIWSIIGGNPPSRLPWIFTSLLCGIGAGLLYLVISGKRFSLPAALLAPLPFIAHPVCVDVVLPWVGQADLLAAIGVLGAVVFWRRPGIVTAILGSLFLLLGFFSKESSFPAPAAIPLLILFSAGTWKQRQRLAIRAFVIATCLLLFRFATQAFVFGGLARPEGAGGSLVGTGERAVGFLEIIGRYTAALFGVLSPATDYSFLKQENTPASIYPAVGGIAIVAISAVLITCLWRYTATKISSRRLRPARLIAAGICWIVLFLVPYLHIIPIGAIWGTRFAFLPLMGFMILIASVCTLTNKKGLIAAGVISTAALVFWGGMLYNHAQEWKDPKTLWTAETQRNPDRAFAWKNLASYLQQDGEEELALEAIRNATTLWSGFGEAWLAHGQIASRAGLRDEARKAFTMAEQLMPSSLTVQLEIAKLDASQGNLNQAIKRLTPLADNTPEAQQLLQFMIADREKRKNSTH